MNCATRIRFAIPFIMEMEKGAQLSPRPLTNFVEGGWYLALLTTTRDQTQPQQTNTHQGEGHRFGDCSISS